ncbi:hypothetical protein MPL3356_60665 [Mesorhizobium plurifarium]|uniref:Uncharacterized protein n=1 Tax=Mesorhizobium plurifarium TaxID=69974 RepID=A0A090FG14_MESPL|nr:hypothetical protein MPL3356_60665 [Mesorhizobium plurifarium]CDX40576.1 hypothetical protein MPLDJ20_280022 [Mesorhizobium plurifarium]
MLVEWHVSLPRRLLGDGFAGVKWTRVLADTPMKAFSWGLFFRAAKKIAILTRRLF